MAHPVSPEKHLLAVEGNEHKDPRLDSVQRMGDLGALSPKWDVFIEVLPSRLRDLCGRGAERR